MTTQTTFTRVGKGQRNDTAYAVHFDGGNGRMFLGYVVGRGQGWDRQFTLDSAEPVKPTHQFVYAQPSRAYVAALLVEDWTRATGAQR